MRCAIYISNFPLGKYILVKVYTQYCIEERFGSQLIGFLRFSYSLLFPNCSHQKRFIFVFQRDEPEGWTSSPWTNTLELHKEDFRATNVIDWEECFSNKTLNKIFLNRNRLLNARGGVERVCRAFTLYKMVTFPRKHFCSRTQISQYFQLQHSNWLLIC